MANRRTLLKGIGTAGLAGIAGCLGDDNGQDEDDDVADDSDTGDDQDTDDAGDDTLDDEDQSWPPQTVELVTASSPGGGVDVYNTGAQSILSGVYPQETEVRHGVFPGAGQAIGANRVYNSDLPENPKILMATTSALILSSELDPEITEYNADDWDDVAILPWRPPMPSIWSVHMGSIGPDENFAWDWDDFIAHADDMVVGSTGLGDTIQVRALEHYSNELEMGTINIVNYGGGSEVRAAMLRGEVDVYVTSIGGTFRHERQEQYYNGQFIMSHRNNHDDEIIGLVEQQVEDIYEESPEVAYGGDPTYLGDLDGYPDEGAENVGALIGDWMWFLSPGISDDNYDRHLEVIDEFNNSAEWLAYTEETRGTLVGEWTDCSGDCAKGMYRQSREAFQEVLQEIPEEELRA